MTDQPRLSTHGKGTSSQQLSCHKRNMTHTHRQCTLRDDIMHLNGPINLTLMILSHNTRSWRPATRLRGQPRLGQARTACLPRISSTKSHGTAIHAATKPANIDLVPALSSTDARTRARAVDRAAKATRPAIRPPGRSSTGCALSTRPASVVDQPASLAAAIDRSDRKPCARDVCGRAERGCAFDRRSRAHIDELKHLLLHVPRDGESDGGHLQEQPFLTRTRPHAATASMCSQHTVSVCRIGYVRSFRRPKHALPSDARLSKACGRRTKGVALQRSSPRSAKASRSSCRASGAQRAWMIPSAKRGFR